MNLLEIGFFSLGLLFIYGCMRRVYYAIRYPGRYCFRKHIYVLNAEEHGKIATALLSTLITAKIALDEAHQGTYPKEFVEMIEGEHEAAERLAKSFVRTVYISPTFKMDFHDFQSRQKKKLKMLMEQAALQELKVPEDSKKGN